MYCILESLFYEGCHHVLWDDENLKGDARDWSEGLQVGNLGLKTCLDACQTTNTDAMVTSVDDLKSNKGLATRLGIEDWKDERRQLGLVCLTILDTK